MQEKFKEWKVNQNSRIQKWKIKYRKKRSSSKQSNIKFNLSFDEYIFLAFKSNINSPSKISCKGDSSKMYQLARYKDLGSYCIDNCRFITMEENRKERDQHYSQSESNIQRVKNGTHNFLGGELSKKIAKERVKNGTHNFLGIPPWENGKSTKDSLEVWKISDLCYKWWLDNNKGCKSLGKNFNLKSQRACQSIIIKFKQGWIPNKDIKWLSWKTFEKF